MRPFTAEWIFDLLNQRRLELGLTQTEVTKRALGYDNADVFQKLRRGSVPSATRLKAACDALGLEFYVGPPRGESASAPPEAAGASAQRFSDEALREEIHTLRDTTIAAIREENKALREEMARREAADRIEATLKEVISRLPRLSQDLEDDSALAEPGGVIEFPGARQVAVRELDSAAGAGAEVLSERVKGYIYFRDEWLSKHRLNPDKCNVIGVKGESMEPLLPDGCSILVDHNRRHRRAGHFFVVRGGDGLVVKKAGKDESGGWLLLSEHPAWKPVSWPGDAEIIGEVKWMARTL